MPEKRRDSTLPILMVPLILLPKIREIAFYSHSVRIIVY